MKRLHKSSQLYFLSPKLQTGVSRHKKERKHTDGVWMLQLCVSLSGRWEEAWRGGPGQGNHHQLQTDSYVFLEGCYKEPLQVNRAELADCYTVRNSASHCSTLTLKILNCMQFLSVANCRVDHRGPGAAGGVCFLGPQESQLWRAAQVEPMEVGELLEVRWSHPEGTVLSSSIC